MKIEKGTSVDFVMNRHWQIFGQNDFSPHIRDQGFNAFLTQAKKPLGPLSLVREKRRSDRPVAPTRMIDS